MDVNTPQPGQIIEYKGEQARVTQAGAIQSVATGKFIAPPTDAPGRITSSERGAALAHIRWHGEAQDGYKRAIQAALAERNDAAVIDTIEQARGKGIELITSEIALNAGVREDWRIKAHEHALLQSGMDAREPKQAQQQVQGATLSMDRDTAVAVAQAVAAEMSKRGIVDG